jgi:RNA polymerase sigma-70 factor (ECF subfamily)
MDAFAERLARLLAEGSPRGMEELYDAYGSLAYTLALRVVRDPHIAEDVVQETFLAVWRRSESYDSSRGSLKNWLCRICRNRAIDRVRRGRSRTAFGVSIDEAVNEPSLSDTWSQVAAELTRQQVRQALDELPADQRQTLELAYFGGYSQTEISQAMEVPLGTVKGRARLGLARLRGQLTAVAQL